MYSLQYYLRHRAGQGPLPKFSTPLVLISHVSVDFMALLKAKKGECNKIFLSAVPYTLFFYIVHSTVGVFTISILKMFTFLFFIVEVDVF